MNELKIFAQRIDSVNGPGKRLTFWLAGCGLGCENCINAHINDKQAPGDMMTVDQIMAIIKLAAKDDKIDGVSLSGGEPLLQKRALTQLLKRIKAETKLTVLLYTGLTYQEISGARDTEFLAYLDVALSGRFDPTKFSQSNPIGHKEILIFSKAYSKRQVRKSFDNGAEIIIDMNTGDLTISGVNSVNLGVLK